MRHGLPPDVLAAIDEALGALDRSAGRLLLPDRRRLRAVLGSWTPLDRPGRADVGLLRRAELSAACARRALPVWERAFPGDRRPHGLIEATLAELRASPAEAAFAPELATLEADVEALGPRREMERPFVAGRAAVNLGYEVWQGELDPDLHGPEPQDEDLEEPPVERLSAWAWHGRDDPAAERLYWRWYITEALPEAYLAVPGPLPPQ